MQIFTVTHRYIAIFAAILIWNTSSASTVSHAASAQQFVEKVGGSVMAAARAGSTAKFRALMQRNASIPAIAIYSLGPFRKKLPASRKKEYYRLVSRHISKVFTNHSKKLAGRSIKAGTVSEKGRSVIVKSTVQFPSGKRSKVTWRLLKSGSGFKIFDINVQGIWLASTQKTDFTSVLRSSGGDINALFSYLKR